MSREEDSEEALMSSCSDPVHTFVAVTVFFEQFTAFAHFESGPNPLRNKTGRVVEAEPERAFGAGERPHQARATHRPSREAPAILFAWACLGEENEEHRMARCWPDMEDASKCEVQLSWWLVGQCDQAQANMVTWGMKADRRMP